MRDCRRISSACCSRVYIITASYTHQQHTSVSQSVHHPLQSSAVSQSHRLVCRLFQQKSVGKPSHIPTPLRRIVHHLHTLNSAHSPSESPFTPFTAFHTRTHEIVNSCRAVLRSTISHLLTENKVHVHVGTLYYIEHASGMSTHLCGVLQSM